DVGLIGELGAQPDALGDLAISRHIPGELLDRIGLRPGATFETGPVRRDGDPALSLRGLFDQDPEPGRHRSIVPAAPNRRPKIRAGRVRSTGGPTHAPNRC